MVAIVTYARMRRTATICATALLVAATSAIAQPLTLEPIKWFDADNGNIPEPVEIDREPGLGYRRPHLLLSARQATGSALDGALDRSPAARGGPARGGQRERPRRDTELVVVHEPALPLSHVPRRAAQKGLVTPFPTRAGRGRSSPASSRAARRASRSVIAPGVCSCSSSTPRATRRWDRRRR